MYTRAKEIGGKVMAGGENNVNSLAVADMHICCHITFLLLHHAPFSLSAHVFHYFLLS